jgi:L-ascorbate metabolism protein UlaG (beta-lactamase superfamily)
LEEIRSHKDGLAIWWMGNAGWLIKAGGVLIGTDLDLEPTGKVQPPPLTAEALAPLLDIAFVTHHHGDHFNRSTLKALSNGQCTFVLPRSCVKRLAGLPIPQGRIIVPEPLKPLAIKNVRVEPINAIHGNQEFTVLTREPDFAESIATSCGYVFNIGGKRLLQPGDSVLTEQHLSLKDIDVLFVSPTVHNMYIDGSMLLINRLQPAYIFAQHFGTYQEAEDNIFWTRGYPDELKLRLSRGLQNRFRKPRLGEKFIIR